MTTSQGRDVAEVIEIRDPDIDVEAVMAQIRANVARRRAEGAYRDDLDAIAQEVYDEVVTTASTSSMAANGPHVVPLGDLQAQWMIREHVFTSQAPVVGPLIVAVRNAWHSMAAKWALRVVIQQIQAFHLVVARAFQDIDTEHRELAERVQDLERLVEQQSSELAALRQELLKTRSSDTTGTEARR